MGRKVSEQTYTHAIIAACKRERGTYMDPKVSVGKFIDVRLSPDGENLTVAVKLNRSSTEKTKAGDTICCVAHFDEAGTFEVPIGNGDVMRVKLPFVSVRKPKDEDKKTSGGRCTCGHRLGKSRFCPNCGAEVNPKRICANCGAEVSGRYCGECGADTDGAPHSSSTAPTEPQEEPQEIAAADSVDVFSLDDEDEDENEPWEASLASWEAEVAVAKKSTGPTARIRSKKLDFDQTFRLRRNIPSEVAQVILDSEDTETKITCAKRILSGTPAEVLPESLLPLAVVKFIEAQTEED